MKILHRTSALTSLLTITGLLSGCFNSDSSPTASVETETAEEQAAIEFVMEEGETNLELTVVDALSYGDSGSEGAAAAPINTHRWFREPQSADRKLEIVIENPSGSPATASVNASGAVYGLLHLWGCEGDAFREVVKDFDDAGSRQLLFQRVRPQDRVSDREHRGWQLVAVSGIELASRGATRQIHSVRVQSGDVDQTFTDMAALIRVQNLMRFGRDAEVTVTVDTGDATDAVFLHVQRQRRSEFRNNDDGTFTATFFANGRGGAHHFAVDVLSDGTLYDDTEAYDNVAWGLPFIIDRLPEDDGASDQS